MKFKQRATAFLLSVLMLFTSMPAFSIQAFAAEFTPELEICQDGSPVSEVVLPIQEKVHLSAETKLDGVFQWQIRVTDNVWANIVGEDNDSVELSYAMVANLLNGEQARIRCKLGTDAGEVYSKAVTVDVDFDAVPEFPEQPTMELPVVIQDAIPEHPSEPVERPAEPDYQPEITDDPEDMEPVETPSAPESPAEPEAPVKQPETPAEPEEDTSADSDIPVTSNDYDEPDFSDDREAVTDSIVSDESEQPEVADFEESDNQAEDVSTFEPSEDNESVDSSAYVEDVVEPAEKPAEKNIFSFFSRSRGAQEQADDEPVLTTHLITIEYVLEDGTPVANPFTAQVADGTGYQNSVTSPVVTGYEPADDEKVIELDYDSVTQDITRQVVYYPAQVDFKVEHYQQNVGDDGYTLVDTDTISDHVTGTEVGAGLGNSYAGFVALLYDETTQVAADGSTVVKVYYDRLYFLMSFDLDGGYGVDPIYARYGTPIDDVGEPKKAGYFFAGWNPNLPDTMPDRNTTYTAQWVSAENAKVTVVYWGENADDEEYSYVSSAEIEAKVGSNFTYTGNTLVCTQEVHTHTDACYGACSHTHTVDCWRSGNRALISATKPTQITGNNFVSGTVYSYTANRTTHYYLYLNGSWYCGANNRGQAADTQTITENCNHIHNESCLSCGKQEHTHNNSCYLNAGLDAKLWKFVKSDTVTVAADGSSIVNVYYDRTEFTFTFTNNNRTIHTFSAKWGADISDKWSFRGSDNNQYPQTNPATSWTPSGSSTYTQRITRLERMPAENITFRHTTSTNTTRHFYYYVESLPGASGDRTVNGKNYDLYLDLAHDFNQIYYNDDFFLLEGFTREAIRQENNNTVNLNPGGNTSWNNTWNSKLYFYYTRNQYDLVLNNGETNEKTESVYYQASLAEYNSFVPTLPSFYEPGSRVFDGWYLNPQCSGEEYDLTKHTMPAANLILYAKWVPITHTVTTRLTEDATDMIDTWTVPHGSVVPNAPENPTNGDYEFVGWFYKDNGVEKAFDFSMQVRQDMELYAKWRSNKIMPITIHYVTVVNGEEITIADDTTSSGLAGTTKTFEAKTGSELYDGYQEGFFPTTSSHNLEIRIDIENEFTFVYVAKENVKYTVKYLEEGTNAVLHEQKNGETSHAVVTEEYERIAGYRPDAFQKRLVLSSDDGENVLIFYYVKDEVHAPVQITHYTENITGGGYSVYQDETNLDAIIGQTYNATAISIPGFTFDSTIEGTLMEGELTAAGLHLKLYYTRNSYPYEFQFREQGTNTVLEDPENGFAKYQASVTENAKEIEGYEVVGATQQTVVIAIEDGETAVKNVKIFYYTEKEVTINYVAVGPVGEDFGSVTPETESVKVKTGTAAGSTPTAADGYRFEGWYLDEACTQPVDATWVENDKITPQKGEDEFYQEATYYAKFVPAVADLTITKSGAQSIDENQSFVFHVVGDGLDGSHTDMKVVIRGNDSVTIKDLPCGTYTVTEETTWSWRYTPTNDTQNVNLTPADATVGFGNTRTADKWLNGAAWCDNRWIDGKRH